MSDHGHPLLAAAFGRKVTQIGPHLLLIERKIMRLRLIHAALGMLVLSLGVPAYGVNCFQIWDARENLVYQSIDPPFDLARPAFDRAMANLRSQRRTFIFFDTPVCALIGIGTDAADTSGSADPASILDIRTTIGPGGSRGARSGVLSPVPGSIGAAAPGGAPPQAGMSGRGSTPTTTGVGRAPVVY
jgi:hypothetical protein